MAAVSSYVKGLNSEQRDAVLHTDGPMLVIAGAGSGKTRVITRRVARLIAEGHAVPQEILAVTFTNKAAAEMRSRIAGLVGKKAAAAITISTFHSFCLKVLREHIEAIGYRRNFTISSEGDTRTLIRRILGDMDGVDESFSPDILREQIGLLKGGTLEETQTTQPSANSEAEEATREKYRLWVPEVYERYQSALRAANTLDFDDLLLCVLKLWQEHPDVLQHYQERFRFVSVDEYQDTNHVQYDLVRLLVGAHQNLCVVGDDDQSIYGWRGADVRNILNFERDYPAARIVTLSQNYRSTGTILHAANSVISNNAKRRSKKMRTDQEMGRAIDLLITGDEEHEATMVVTWMEHIQSKTGARHRDFAILYRSNLQSRPLEIAFRKAAIPYQVVGGQSFFERAEVRDILAYLKILTNPRDEASFLRVVNVPRRGIGDVTLHGVHDICRERGLSFGKGMAEALKSGRVNGQAERGVRAFLGLMSEYRGHFRDRSHGLGELIRDLVEKIGYRGEVERLSKTPEAAAFRWENVEAVIQAATEYDSAEPKGTLSGFLDATSLNPDSADQGRDDGPQNAVTMMTVHSAKGLEYPFVFVVGTEEGLFPHEKSVRENTLDEERRLFYVALTRAQRHISLFETLSRSRFGREKMSTSSRFLSEIPHELVRRRIHAARDMVEARVNQGNQERAKKNGKKKVKKS